MDALQKFRPVPEAFFRRGLEMWELGRDADVLRDMEVCLAAPTFAPNSLSYAAFAAALSARRLGQPAKADAYLAAVEKAASLDFWRSAVHAYLSGKSTADEFLNKGRHNGEHTEAHFYIGVTAALAGRREEAVQHLQWIKERGARQYVEYRMGIAELERLEGQGSASR